MFDTGIPADKLGFELVSGSSDAGLKQAIEKFINKAKANKLTIVDVSIAGNNIGGYAAAFFFLKP